MMKRSLVLVMLAICIESSWGQSNSGGYLLDWTAPTGSSQGLVEWLHSRLDPLVKALAHFTSPDIPRDARRLWRVSSSGTDACVLTTDSGVHLPRWGRGGYILYLVEADTNGDGKIDALDDYLIRIVPEGGGAGRTIAQGKSATWSPDGKYVAFTRGGRVAVVSREGEAVTGDAVPGGQLVMSNSPNPEVARAFWAVDARNGTQVELPSDLSNKYLWMGLLSPSGAKVVYANTSKTILVVSDPGKTQGTPLVSNGALNMDPSWSPDEKSIVYVSTLSRGKMCAAQP